MANIFELNINLNTTGNSEAEIALNNTTNGALTETAGEIKKEGGSPTANVAIGLGMMAAQAVKQSVNQVMNYQISKIGTAYGDVARQNEINNIMTTVNMVGNIGTKVMSGATAGSAGGPVGAIIGAVVGLVVGVGETAIGIATRVETYNIQQSEYIVNSNYTKERLGILAASKGR